MLNQPTADKLRSMGLTAMAEAWTRQQAEADVAALAFDERFALLVEAEWVFRENRRLSRALREAKLKLSSACLEDIDYSPRRELDKSCRPPARLLPLGRRAPQRPGHRHDRDRQDVPGLRPGPAGMPQGLPRHLSPRLAALLRARTGPRRRHLGSRAQPARRVDVLVLDDWAMAPIKDDERRDLLELLEDRYGTRSTVVTSQMDPKRWHDHIADPNHADAICDRLLHNAHRIALKGPSKRKEEGSAK